MPSNTSILKVNRQWHTYSLTTFFLWNFILIYLYYHDNK